MSECVRTLGKTPAAKTGTPTFTYCIVGGSCPFAGLVGLKLRIAKKRGEKEVKEDGKRRKEGGGS